jgi:hypothetical protein
MHSPRRLPVIMPDHERIGGVIKRHGIAGRHTASRSPPSVLAHRNFFLLMLGLAEAVSTAMGDEATAGAAASVEFCRRLKLELSRTAQ